MIESWPILLIPIALGALLGMNVKVTGFGRALVGLIGGATFSIASGLLGHWAWNVPIEDLFSLRVVSQGVIGVAVGYLISVVALVVGVRHAASKFQSKGSQ